MLLLISTQVQRGIIAGQFLPGVDAFNGKRRVVPEAQAGRGAGKVGVGMNHNPTFTIEVLTPLEGTSMFTATEGSKAWP
jgi:hypothetical protein